jgi:hypothetical protein
MKRFQSFFTFFSIILLLLIVLMINSCDTNTTAAAAETETQTQAPITTVATETSNSLDGESHAESPATDDYQILPLSDISCILGYWEVETDSLLAAANSLVSSNSIIIFTRVEPSIIYAFYMGDETDTTIFRMDIWYDNVLVTGNVQGSGDESDKTIDMHLNGVITSEISSEREGQIIYRPVEGENSLEITDMWLNGALMSDSPMDISDFADTTNVREFLFECLGNNRIKITYPEASIYLGATTRTQN